MDGVGLYQLISKEELLIEICQDGGLIYNQETGATSFVSEFAVSMLTYLRMHGPLPESAVFSAMRELCESESDFHDTCASLEAAQLISRC